MRLRTALVLILLTQLLSPGLAEAQFSNVIGNWKLEINFSNGQKRVLRFEALASGKGSFLPEGPGPSWVDPAQPSTAAWTQPDKDSVTFSGPVQFPLGNVGIERGTLVLKGKVRSDGTVSGEASLFSVDQETNAPTSKPAKSGTFRATRVTL